MTRISEAVECLESLGYTITAPGGERSARTTADALAEKPFGSLSREERLLFAIFNPERYWENRAAYYQERAETAEAKIAAVQAIVAEYPPTASSNPRSEEGMRRAARYAVAARIRLALTPAVQS